MDGIVKRALFLSVVVFFSLFLISKGISFYTKTEPILNTSSSKLDTVSAQLDSIDFKSFNGTTISGSEVISAINTKASSNITVTVKTSSNPSGKAYNSASYNIKDIYDNNYIEATAQFLCELEETDNGTVTGIKCEQK